MDEIARMNTIEETRRTRLLMLAKKHGGISQLCKAMGATKQESGLNRIANANLRHERGGKPYEMGSKQAREIEAALQLPVGWMDTPPSYAELHGEESPLNKAMLVMESMDPATLQQALKVLDALAQPAAKTAT